MFFTDLALVTDALAPSVRILRSGPQKLDSTISASSGQAAILAADS